jgi:hypothetical protein
MLNRKLKATVWFLFVLPFLGGDLSVVAFSSHLRFAVLPSAKRDGSTLILRRQSNQDIDQDLVGQGESSSISNKLESDLKDNDVTKPPPPLPTLATYRKFALPCLALWIASPLLSLVDTAFVGLSGAASTSALQLAALGPATTFVDGATYLFAFLNVAATNLYASACAQHGAQSEKAESVIRTAAKVAMNSGLGLMVFLLAFSRPLLALYVGTLDFCHFC